MDAATSVPKVPRKKPDAVDLAERTLRDFLAEMDRAANGAGKLELRPFLERFAATLDEHAANERERIAAALMDRHDELQENMTLGVRPMASMITGTLREIADELSPGYVEKRYAASMKR